MVPLCHAHLLVSLHRSSRYLVVYLVTGRHFLKPYNPNLIILYAVSLSQDENLFFLFGTSAALLRLPVMLCCDGTTLVIPYTNPTLPWP